MLPAAFLQRMQAQLGDEFSQYLESLERPRAVALRFHPQKAHAQVPFLTEDVPWEPLGHYYDPAARPGLHPYHEAGVYYLQEASAMSAVALLDPQPGERICDLCAAPGGKSTQIAGRLQGQGFLLSNEWSPKRARILSQNIERMGVSNALVTNETADRLAKFLPGFFDRVLIDAPCSGEGMFRKEEAAITDWSQETVQMCAHRQAQILDAGAGLLRKGGRLVYSTCTFAPEENELTIEAFLQRNPEFILEAVQAPWFTPAGPGQFRLWPHKLLGEGHFAAVLRKLGDETAQGTPCPGQKLPKEWTAFAKEMDIQLPPGKAILFGQTLYWAPEELPSLQGLKALRPGLELGEVKKDRFQPAHALALWLPNCKNTVSYGFDSPEMAAFLHGEVLASTVRGWCQVQVDGFGIGWAKGDGNQLKNHYPKGLRR